MPAGCLSSSVSSSTITSGASVRAGPAMGVVYSLGGCSRGRVCAGARGTKPGGGSRAKPIPGGIGEPDDPDPAQVSVRHPRARGRASSHLRVLQGEAECLLGGQRDRARVTARAALADRFGVEVVDQQRPVDLAGQAATAGESGGHQAGVVVPAKAGKLKRLLHAQEGPRVGGSTQRGGRETPHPGGATRSTG